MGSSDELVAKLRGGSAANYDVISPSSDVAASIARTGLAAPLNLSKLPAYSQLSAKLRDLPLVKANGQVYGVPFMWGPDPLLYDTTAFAQPPDSWTVFWTRNTRENCRFGMIYPLSIWPRKFLATTNPTRRSSTI